MLGTFGKSTSSSTSGWDHCRRLAYQIKFAKFEINVVCKLWSAICVRREGQESSAERNEAHKESATGWAPWESGFRDRHWLEKV